MQIPIKVYMNPFKSPCCKCVVSTDDDVNTFQMLIVYFDLKELHHNLLSHYFDFLNYGLSVEKPKNNGSLRKKTPKGRF